MTIFSPPLRHKRDRSARRYLISLSCYNCREEDVLYSTLLAGIEDAAKSHFAKRGWTQLDSDMPICEFCSSPTPSEPRTAA